MARSGEGLAGVQTPFVPLIRLEARPSPIDNLLHRQHPAEFEPRLGGRLEALVSPTLYVINHWRTKA